MADRDSKKQKNFAQEPAGTSEHLAVRYHLPSLDPAHPEIKQRLRNLRIEITRLVTSLRWEKQSIAATADTIVSLLGISNLEQWKGFLIPFLYEIDRSGTLLPVWIHIIMRGDPLDLPTYANPAETREGIARRIAVLMLGNYKTIGIRAISFSDSSKDVQKNISLSILRETQDPAQFLGYLATKPDISLYATQALLKHANLTAMQALVEALSTARGWAKVDVVEALLSLHQEHFYPLLLASGLNDALGLESYLAIPLYRTILLTPYLGGNNDLQNTSTDPRPQQQAALIFQQVLQETLQQPLPTSDNASVPLAFEQHLPSLTNALFTGARQHPQWQNTVALHYLSLLMSRYWHAITQHHVLPSPLLEQVEQSLPYMHEIEAWMQNEGRETLLSSLADPNEKHPLLSIKVLHELREPRLNAALIQRLHSINAQVVNIDTLCNGTENSLIGKDLDEVDDKEREAISLLQELCTHYPDITSLLQETLRSLATE